MSSLRPASLFRRSAALAALACVAGLAQSAAAQNWHWNAGTGSWSNAGNWLGFLPPPPSANVFIGSSAPAQNATVTLDQTASVANLVITDGMTLATGPWNMSVAGTTSVSGWNTGGIAGIRSTLRLGARDGQSLTTHDVNLSDRGWLVVDGGLAQVSGSMDVSADSDVDGDGILSFSGAGTTLVNNGRIGGGTDGGLVLIQSGGGRYDLDGTSGDGMLYAASYDPVTHQAGRIRVEGVGLTDAFSGDIMLSNASRLDMNLDEGWVADVSSNIRVLSHVDFTVATRITGSAWDFAGTILMDQLPTGGNAPRLNVESAAITLRPQARLEMDPESRVAMGGAATTAITVLGGTYAIAQDGMLTFEAPTTVRGGQFSTPSTNPADGLVEFLAHTTYNGSPTFTGFARQVGDATVSGATTITADRFYMSVSDQTDWHVSNALAIVADSIGPNANVFRGNMTIGGGFLGRFTPDVGTGVSDGLWTMEGELTLQGDSSLFITRLAGSDFQLRGSLTVPSGRAQITADTFLDAGSTVSLPSATSILRTRAYLSVEPGVQFDGVGVLQNGPGGTALLHDGVALGQVGFVNQGLAFIALETGIVAVDRFTNTADGTLAVTILGWSTGFQHDQMLVSGGSAILDGILSVAAAPAGPGGMLPSVGDEFTIITALGGVSGQFVNQPVTFYGEQQLNWSVVYSPNSVVLRLDSIVPSPGTGALLAVAGIFAARRRRSA